MAKALLINKDDIPKKTLVNGNVDTDLFVQYIEIAQDIHIQSYLGSDLLAACQTLITAGTLGDAGNEAYETLVQTWCKPALIHWTMVEYLPFAAYSVSDKGVYKHTSENASNAEKFELDALIEKHRDTAEHYTQRMIDYLTNNSNSFTEYTSNSNEDMSPDKDTNFSGWYL
jgi:hypothetical protein